MADSTWWKRPSSISLRRDMEDILDEFEVPRSLRRELGRLFEEELSPPSMWTEMERLFDDFLQPPTLRRRVARLFEPLGIGTKRMLGGAVQGGFSPEIDLAERDDAWVLRVDVPGVRDQDVNVSVDDENVLTVTGERRREESKRERGYEYTERSYGSFSRSIQLPRGADTNKIAADMRAGVLEVRIPKGEAARKRQIPVQVGQDPREEPRVLEASEGGRRDKPQQVGVNASRS